MTQNQLVLASAIALILSACSNGSDSSGGDDFNSAISTAPVQITQENWRKIASTSTNGVQSAGELGRGNMTDGEDLLQPTSQRFLDNAARMILGKPSPLTSRASSSFSEDCDGGGSMKFTVNDRNNNEELDAGDSVSVTYSNCAMVDEFDGTRSIMDGSTSFRINSMSGTDSSNSSINVTLEINKLTLTETSSNETVYVDGDINLATSTNNDSAELSISGSKIEFNDSEEFGLIRDYDMQQSWNVSTEQWTQSLNAKLASTDIEGQIEITTPVPLQGKGDSYPIIGTTTVTGANGSYVSLNADTGNNETLILTIFDGGTSVSEEVFWSELDD